MALGYTLVYGIIELINFAHGDVFMWGTMITVTMAAHRSRPGRQPVRAGDRPAGVLLTLLAAMAFCGALNVGDRARRLPPLRNAPKLAPLITAIGVSFILQDVASAQSTGSATPSVGRHHSRPRRCSTSAASPYRLKSLLVVLITIPVLLALVYVVRNTRQGKAMRAVAQDTEAARMMGIDVDRTIAFTFAAGRRAGRRRPAMLYVMFCTQTRFDLGFQLGLFAFTAAVLGGIGNLTGAALGAL